MQIIDVFISDREVRTRWAAAMGAERHWREEHY